MADGFPEDQARQTRDMQRRLDQAQGSAGRRPPLLEASAGWIFTDRSTPPTPAAGKTHIYSQGGRLWASSTAGAVPLLLPEPPEDPLRYSVTPLPGLTTPNAWPGSYTPATGELVQDDLQRIRDKVNEIIDSLERP